jgi:hypothetical protein
VIRTKVATEGTTAVERMVETVVELVETAETIKTVETAQPPRPPGSPVPAGCDIRLPTSVRLSARLSGLALRATSQDERKGNGRRGRRLPDRIADRTTGA